MLFRSGHQVTVAAHGQQGVQFHASQRFDLILMDLQMPVMDGIEATRAIRQRERQSSQRSYTPIVAMTADAMPGVRERCVDAGMDGYVTKPVNPQYMQQEIERAMRRAMPSMPQMAQPLPVLEPTLVWDLARVLRITSAPRDLVLGVTAGFLRDAPGLLDDAPAAAAREDTAHALALMRRMAAIASALALDVLARAEAEDRPLTVEMLRDEVARKGLEPAFRRISAALRPGDRFSGGEAKKIDADLLLHQAMTLHRRALVLHTELRAAERALSEDPRDSNFALLADLKAQLMALDGTEAEPETELSQSLDRPPGFR